MAANWASVSGLTSTLAPASRRRSSRRGWQGRGDRRAVDVLGAPQHKKPQRQHGARIPRRDHRLRALLFDPLKRHAHGGIPLGARGAGGVVLHRDDLRGVLDRQCSGGRPTVAPQRTSSLSMRRSSPMRTTRQLPARTAARAPSTSGRGASSLPIASRATVSMISGRGGLVLLDVENLAIAVLATALANAVRLARLAALAADDLGHRGRAHPLRATVISHCFALFTLRNRHFLLPF